MSPATATLAAAEIVQNGVVPSPGPLFEQLGSCWRTWYVVLASAGPAGTTAAAAATTAEAATHEQ